MKSSGEEAGGQTDVGNVKEKRKQRIRRRLREIMARQVLGRHQVEWG